MDYLIRRNPKELDSTGYIELGPGRYTGKHWQPGSLFVREDAFGRAEGIVARHLPGYNHFYMNDIPEEVGRGIIRDWRAAAESLARGRPDDTAQLLNLEVSLLNDLEEEVEAQWADVAAMLRDLANECERFYRQEGWICILGV